VAELDDDRLLRHDRAGKQESREHDGRGGKRDKAFAHRRFLQGPDAGIEFFRLFSRNRLE
jgi:hypothetical protein